MEATDRPPYALWAAATTVVLVLLGLWQGNGYWEYSDGVYSLSARQIAAGETPYEDFAAAQPPLLLYLGAGVLSIADEPVAIRVAMALCSAVTSLLTLVIVRRLTTSRPVALGAAVVVLLTPWAVREHAQLLPETVAAPLVLAVALLASRDGRAPWVGVLGAAAIGLKVAMALPVLGVILLGRARARTVIWLAAAVAAGSGLALAVFGSDAWDSIVTAQRETGTASLRYVGELWAQGLWNLLPIAVPAALAWRFRERIADRELALTTLGAAAGAVLLLGTLAKNGSYLTVMVVIEPPLVCLAACGIAGALAERRAARPLAMVAAAALAFGLLQVASLVAEPDDPKLFTRPFADSGPERVLSGDEVDRIAGEIAACPPGTQSAAAPFLALHAGRDIAGRQPDRFLIAEAPVLRRFLQQSDRARVCAVQ